MPRIKSKLPAIMVYTGDWKQDTSLGKSCAATRGVWWELILAMHEDGRTGKISGTLEQLAKICRCTNAEISSAKHEIFLLEIGDVTERDGIVTFINRRMQREHKERERSRLGMKRARRYENVTGDVNPPLHPFTLSTSITLSKRKKALNGQSSIESGEETEFQKQVLRLLGPDSADRDGQKWLNRFRTSPENKRRAKSVFDEMNSMLTEGKVIKKRGGCAEDLWKRWGRK